MSNSYLCKKCEIKLLKIINFSKDRYNDKFFENHIYLFKYDNQIRKLIIDYKFNDMPYLYKTFSLIIQKYVKFDNYDLIIPVPISRKRYKVRGYNQCDLIAKEISKYCKIEFNSKILKKHKDNIAQSSLSKERKREKCYRCI